MQVLCEPDKGNHEPNGKGVRREAESEGSRRQNAGPTNRKRIEAIMPDETAKLVKVQSLYGRRDRRCDGHKREGRCVIPGETCVRAMSYRR